MDSKETKRFDKLYARHLQMLKLQGKSDKTRDAYARGDRTERFFMANSGMIGAQLSGSFGSMFDSMTTFGLFP